MTHSLVPYVQDSKKWIDHYMAQAMKQAKRKDLTKEYKGYCKTNHCTSHNANGGPSRTRNEAWEGRKPHFEPIKVTPSFNSTSHSKNQQGRNI